jgi:hypothetical protein
MTDYAQEQSDELEALSSIFADDLQGVKTLCARKSHCTAADGPLLAIAKMPVPLLACRFPVGQFPAVLQLWPIGNSP